MALDKKTGDSLCGNIKEAAKQEAKEQKTPPQVSFSNSVEKITGPKWKTLERMATFLTEEQKDGLNNVARKLMKYRAQGFKRNPNRERITANSLIRALVQNFLDRKDVIHLSEIENEEQLEKWVSLLFRN